MTAHAAGYSWLELHPAAHAALFIALIAFGVAVLMWSRGRR